jgi:GcrA cell cycle regulator
MQPSIWTPEHCQALRDYRARGLSYGEIARRLNAKFGTAYTRNAALGRGLRMGLSSPEQPGKRASRLAKIRPTKHPRRAAVPKQTRQRQADESAPPAVRRPRPLRLRSVGITPRLISLIELGPDDCRYPYGGDKDGEAITFCGHPRLPGSSYCSPHFQLTRGDETPSQRTTGPVLLRLVEAA